ncbi:MAG: glycosyltransferase [Verrucomicrobiales bacterium]
MDLSVVICTHNPRLDFLSRTLGSLESQSLDRERWEIVIVDNNSAESLDDRICLDWHPNAAVVKESRVGLTAARLCGIAASRGEMIVFVDDDNELCADYLRIVLEIADKHGFLGAFGAGALEPEFEVVPPSKLNGLLSLLALRTVDRERWSNDALSSRCLPWGAGLCVRRDVAEGFDWLVSKINANEFLGRRGTSLCCGEDDLFSYVCTGKGLGFGVFPELAVCHLIDKRRLQSEYFLRLLKAHSYSHSILRWVIGGEFPSKGGVTDGLKAVLIGIRRGYFSFRCALASVRGVAEAKKFIRDSGLQSVDWERFGKDIDHG